MFRDSFGHIKPMERKYLTNTLFCSQREQQGNLFFYMAYLPFEWKTLPAFYWYCGGRGLACNMCVFLGLKAAV